MPLTQTSPIESPDSLSSFAREPEVWQGRMRGFVGHESDGGPHAAWPLGRSVLMRSLMMRSITILSIAALAACGDQGPESGPGAVIAELVGPEASQGAAEIRLVGAGILAVTGVDGRVFSRKRGDTTVVVIAREAPGSLRFSIQLVDTTNTPAATVVEVAGPDNAIRGNPAAYSVRLGGGE